MKKNTLFFLLVFILASVISFAVSAQTNDTTPPVISSVRAEEVTSNSVKIRWLTDDLSDSKIYYGTASGSYSYSSSSRCDSGGYVIDHCIALNNLNAGMTYYYMVISTNGNTLYSQQFGFQFMTLSSSSGGGGGGGGSSSGSVQLVYPNGGQCYTPGGIVNLYWTKSSSVDHVALYFSPNGYGSRPSQYFYMSSATENYYAWTVPNNITSQGTIWAVVHDSNHIEGIADTNDSYFYISSSCNTATTPTPYPSYSPTPTPTPIPSTTPIPSVAPSAPYYFQSYVSGSNVTLTWTDNHNETSYNIYRRTTGGVWALIKNLSANTTSFLDQNLPAGSYEYDANACNSYGCSAYSAVATAVVGTQSGVYTKTINGKVVFSNGQPVTDAEIGAYSKDTGLSLSTTVDTNGYYSLSLNGGTWLISARPKDPKLAKWTYSGQYVEVIFARDNSVETKSFSTTIIISDNQLTVSVVDEQNMPLANAGITVDTVSAGQQSLTTSTGTGAFLKTGFDGKAIFNLKSGTYYIRGSMPYESGYVNPAEQTVDFSTNESKGLKLIFTKKSLIVPIFINGVVKLNDGNPTDAYVWAWSEKGGSAKTRASFDGKFSLQVTENSIWHLGAGSDINLTPYKSSEITINILTESVSTELILNPISQVSLAPVAMATQTATQDITVKAQDGAKITIPANTVTSTGPISVEVAPTVEAPSQSSARVIGTAYDIKVKNPIGQELREFGTEVTIEIPYKESDLQVQGIGEDKLAPSYFDESTGVWVRVDNYTVDKDRNVIIARVKHLTLFALVLAADITPPSAPSSVKAVATGQGQILLTWVNPSSDLGHIKIYRSESSSSLGRLEGISNGTSFTNNTDIKNGVTYFYVVRSVDTAGNETSNTNYVSVKAIGDSAQVSTGLKEGDMISASGSSDPDIYIINANGYKRLFLNPAIFAFYGHLGGFHNVKSISSSVRDSYKTSGLFRNCETNDSKVYGVEITGEDSGNLHWLNVSGAQATSEDADFFKKVFCINNNEFNWYQKGSNYTAIGQIPAYSR